MFLILFVILVSVFFIWVHRHYSYWKKLEVPGPEPLPVAGNYWRVLTGKVSQGDINEEIYRKYEGYPFVGVYRFTTPCLLVRDPEFIKNIVVRDFKHFQENDVYVDIESDPIFGRNPFVLKGNAWKITRQQLTSCFTSGKIKGMYPLLEKSAERMVKYVEDEMKISSSMECRELCVRFTLDNVGYCAFGIEGKCFDESRSEFRELADQFFSPDNFWQKVKITLWTLFPFLFRFMKIR